jgi:hypothetical protein
VTFGITDGEHLNEIDETIRINPISTGIAQTIGMLLLIDRGHCDEN